MSNKVIIGDFKDCNIDKNRSDKFLFIVLDDSYISLLYCNPLSLNKDKVKSYSMLSRETKEGKDGSNTNYAIVIEYEVQKIDFFYENKKSIIEIDENFYNIFTASQF